MQSVGELVDLIRAMTSKEPVTPPKLKIPLRTVRGDVNPKYLHSELAKLPPYERCDNKLKAKVILLVHEEERAIDEFCGLVEPEPEDPRSWNPQYEPFIPRFYMSRRTWETTKPIYRHGPRMPPFLEGK